MAGSFPVSGSIDAKSFPYLVMNLYRHGATGSLKVDGPSYQKDLYFRNGRILFGSSNDPRDQLGAILIESGRLNPEQLEEVNAKVGPGSPLAKVLAESGLVTQQELTEAARVKVEQILSDILSYAEGSFEFEDGVLPKGAVDLKLQTDRLVVGALRRVADRSYVLGHLGSLEVVLTPSGQPSADMRAVAGELWSQIDGTRTLKEAVAQTRLDEFDGAKLACALLFLGLAERPGGPPAPLTAAVTDDSPFFVADASDMNLDLGATARMAMGETPDAPLPVPPASPVVATPLAFDEPESLPPPRVSEPEPPAFAAFEAPALAPPPRVAPLPVTPPPVAPPAPVSVPPSSFLPTFTPAEPDPDRQAKFPVIEPPSGRDLAAIDALLQSTSAPPPAAAPSLPARAPVARREPPRFSPAPHTRPLAGTAHQGSGRTVLWIALFLVLGGVGGGAAWWYWAGPGRHRSTASAPSTRTPLPEPTLAPEVVEPPVSPASATPEAASTVPAMPVSPAPTATPNLSRPSPSAPSSPSANDARALLRAGRFAEAGNAFAAEARGRRSAFTVQVLVACSDETLQKTAQNVGTDVWFIIPVAFKGRACHRLCWGMFATSGEADAALRQLPEYFRVGGAVPRVVPLASVLP